MQDSNSIMGDEDVFSCFFFPLVFSSSQGVRAAKTEIKHLPLTYICPTKAALSSDVSKWGVNESYGCMIQ